VSGPSSGTMKWLNKTRKKNCKSDTYMYYIRINNMIAHASI